MNIDLSVEYNPILSRDIRVKSKGIIDISTKDRTIIVKGFSEEDIIRIRDLILNEIRNYNENA